MMCNIDSLTSTYYTLNTMNAQPQIVVINTGMQPQQQYMQQQYPQQMQQQQYPQQQVQQQQYPQQQQQYPQQQMSPYIQAGKPPPV